MGKLSKLQRKFHCTFCEKSFLERRQLEDHTNTHTGERPHFCSDCDASFGNRNNRRNHEKLVHFGIRYKCNLCSTLFKYQTDFCKHRKKVHNGRGTCAEVVPRSEEITKRIAVVPNVCQRNNKHSCLFCGKVYQEYRALEMHTNLHTGEQPFSCQNCGESFYSRHNLRDHNKRCHKKEEKESVEVEDQANEILSRKKNISIENDDVSTVDRVGDDDMIRSLMEIQPKNRETHKWDESFFLHLNRYVPGT